MAQLYASNINFESTGNNQIVYASNTVTIRAGGSDVVTVNSTAVTNAAGASLVFTGGLANGSVSTANGIATAINNLVVSGIVVINGVVTPTAIAANTADWAPGVTSVYNINVSANNNVANSEYMITGMTAGTNGQIIVLSNMGPMGIWIRNEEAGSNGAILPGINVPASTAANRFNLPNHFKLQGYQSATFYYDGGLSRWRLTDSSNISFDYSIGKIVGYFSGGSNQITTTDKITYSSESVAASPTNNLIGTGRFNFDGIGNACKGFFIGGYSPAPVSERSQICRIIYPLDTIATVTQPLTQRRRYGATIGNACKGFYVSGYAAGGPVALVPVNTWYSTTERITYATEANALVPGAYVSSLRYAQGAGLSDMTKGFINGGGSTDGLNSSITERINFSTETTATVPGANLIQARRNPKGVGNVCKGFIMSGTIDTPVTGGTSTAERLTYSSETNAAVTGANLPIIRTQAGGSAAACKGFIAGGTNAPVGTTNSTVEKITYSSEVSSTIPSVLSLARNNLQGV